MREGQPWLCKIFVLAIKNYVLVAATVNRSRRFFPLFFFFFNFTYCNVVVLVIYYAIIYSRFSSFFHEYHAASYHEHDYVKRKI